MRWHLLVLLSLVAACDKKPDSAPLPAKSAGAALDYAAMSEADKKQERQKLANEWADKLRGEGKQFERVELKEDTTLEVRGLCTKFVLQNFMSSYGERARAVGVKQIKCTKLGSGAKLDL